MRALAIEDDLGCGELIRGSLQHRWPGCEVKVCPTGEQGLSAVRSGNWDVIVLDLGLPDADGLNVLGGIRSISSSPVLVLTARTSEADLVRGLEIGADNWMTKPFSTAELVARVSAIMRRRTADDAEEALEVLQAGPIKIDRMGVVAYLGSKRLRLTPTQFKILLTLANGVGRVVSHADILREVWGLDDATGQYHLIKVQVRDLRLRIKEADGDPNVIETIRGFGYKIALDR